MEGLGTTDSVLVDILCTSTNAEIRDISSAFSRLFQRDLENDVASETSGDYKKLMVVLCRVCTLFFFLCLYLLCLCLPLSSLVSSVSCGVWSRDS